MVAILLFLATGSKMVGPHTTGLLALDRQNSHSPNDNLTSLPQLLLNIYSCKGRFALLFCVMVDDY